jgi:hypothetical protein
MVSLPTRGTSLRLTASSATSHTVQRARPSGGLLHTIAIKRCFWLSSRTMPRRAAVSHTVPDPNRPADNGGRRFEYLVVSVEQCRRFAAHLRPLPTAKALEHAARLGPVGLAAQQLLEFLLILGGHLNKQGWTSHTLVCAKTFLNWNCFITKS